MEIQRIINLEHAAALRICGCCVGKAQCFKGVPFKGVPFLHCSTWRNKVKELSRNSGNEYQYEGKTIYVEGITKSGL